MKFLDGLVNIVANLGTARDKSTHAAYSVDQLTEQELLSAYRASWLAAAIVDYPAEDATRNWRSWRASEDQITKIEALEKGLGLKSLATRALVASRLYGGSAIYINTAQADQKSPLRPGTEIKSLVLLTSQILRPGTIIDDINSTYYGKPEYYTLSTKGAQVDIHASRLVVFSGRELPGAQFIMSLPRLGGDSVLEVALDVVQQYDSAMANMSSLMYEAKVDVFKFKGFAELLEDTINDDLLTRRLQTQAAMKSINGAVVIDMEDDYQQKSATFTGAPDVITKIQESAAGAAGMPVTRLFGKAIAGLTSSGDGDERLYYDRISQNQETEIGPAMAILDECIIIQALGSRPPEVHYVWAPLRQTTAAERADVFSKTATAARALAGANAGELVPIDALSDSLVNELTELGVLPGLDQAVAKYGSLSEQGLDEGDGGDDTLNLFGDAAPRPLYVSRKVNNAAAILKHYAEQGIDNLIEAGDMHVTVTYSRDPVDWMKMGAAWNSRLTVEPGGPRIMEAFGPDRDTAVLAFASSDLTWRHSEMVGNGASWDWPDYQPHVTIAYEFGGDIEQVKPWLGAIELGPEIFEAIVDTWSDNT